MFNSKQVIASYENTNFKKKKGLVAALENWRVNLPLVSGALGPVKQMDDDDDLI